MSPRAGAMWPVAAFCDPAEQTWGVCVGGPDPLLALGAVGGPAELQPGLGWPDLASASGDWAIRTDGASLMIGPAGAASLLTGRPGAGGELIACQVDGTHTVDGNARALTGNGARSVVPFGGKPGSIRLVCTWFPDGHGVSLLAVRPAGSENQDRDAVCAVVTGEKDGMRLYEPRLSTTYDGDLQPLRMGIEVWVGESEDGDQIPRRVAGASAGSRATRTVAGMRVDACAMRCQSRGDDGVGVYLLLTRA